MVSQKNGNHLCPKVYAQLFLPFLFFFSSNVECGLNQQIITGRNSLQSHAKNLVPNTLAANKTKTTFKTKSHKSSGFNELTFDDATENELIYRHAQKNEDIQINNDKTQNVGHDESHTVAHNRTRYVGNDEAITVEQDVRYKVNRNQFETIAKDLITKVNNTWVEDVHYQHIQTVGQNKSLKVNGEYDVKVKESITTNTGMHVQMGSDKVVIIGGDSKMTLSKGSITLEAASINLKGSVSIGGSGSATVPTLSGAATSGVPYSNECELAG